ncbi:uncharacterized protein [Palaemon carinicauda]|uniref:uncharacterized protein n=1 Tax=Palaemon carinicauda TaxID=392227 RepID=UPI0035B5EE05
MRIQALLPFLTVSSCLLFAVAKAAAVVSECGREDSRCGDGSCLPQASLCNGIPDCPRGEDERHCTQSEEWSTTTEYCNPYEFRCYDGQCIPSRYVCDGYRDCPYGEDEYDCYYSSPDPWWTTPDPWWTTTDPYPWWTTRDPYPRTTRDPYPATTRGPDPECTHPFDIVGGKCIMIEPMVDGTWYETRYFCQRFDADLVSLDSLDFYSELIKLLHQLGLTSRDYWVGASDEGHEGSWYWVNSQKVLNGTPLWAIYYYSSDTYYQEPKKDTSSLQNCGYLDQSRFYYMDDEDCQKQKGAICEKRYFSDASILDEEEYKRAMLELSEKNRDAKGLHSDTKKSTGNAGDFDEKTPDEMEKNVIGARADATMEDQDPDKEKMKYRIIENKLDTKPHGIKNIETVIKNLKARVFQGRFVNMNVLRP